MARIQLAFLFSCFLAFAVKSQKAAVVIHNTNALCSQTLMGRLRFRAPAKLLEICDGKNWLSVAMEDFTSYGRSFKTPGKSCKDILFTNKDLLDNGIYWIKLKGVPSAFPVYCDMKSGGWTMVFKLVSGIPHTPAVVWTTGFAIHEFARDGLHTGNTAKMWQPYKNRIVHQWGVFKPSEARVVLYSRGKKVLHIGFNAKNTNNLNWFSMSRVTEAPWSDLTAKSKNYFSVHGDTHNHRSFYISNHHGGCPGDIGWLVATSRGTCSWENRHNIAAFLYSKTGKTTNWNVAANVGSADVFTVFVR